MFHRIIFVPSVLLLGSVMTAEDQLPSAKTNLTCDEMGKFLREAKIGTQRNIPIGVTRPMRATLDDEDILAVLQDEGGLCQLL